MKAQLVAWLQSQQTKLDEIIANAANRYYEVHKSNANFVYDLKQCHVESYNLSQGRDLCYDRPNTAFAYSLWYHPRRINTFLSFFLDEVLKDGRKSFDIFDLGAGAGAIQWALALIYVGLKRHNIPPPKMHVINIDISPFMLQYSRDYLWREFKAAYPEIDSAFIAEYEVNSWNNKHHIQTTNPIVAASYLFDDSDNQTAITKDFIDLIKQYDPKTVLLITSSTKSRKYFPSLNKEFHTLGYTYEAIAENSLLFNAQLHKVNSIRLRLSQSLSINALGRFASWSDISYSGAVFKKRQSAFAFTDAPRNIANLDIFNPPIRVRRDVTLNEKQIRASRLANTPTVIVGPAGCGKSIVITEKIKKIVEANNYSKDLRILLTTFNKGLLGKLAEWLKDILDPSRFDLKYDIGYNGPESSSHFIFKEAGNTASNIRLLHFDMLPKYYGDVKYNGLVDKSKHNKILAEVIQDVKNKENISSSQYDNILNADFLFDEYHKVIYGLQVGISHAEEKYLSISRTGRGNNPSLQRNSERRRLVFKCLSLYAAKIHNTHTESFTLRRQYLYSKLQKGEIKSQFDYIIVDEFQDCTPADFDIFYRLVKNVNNFTIAGDLAQAVHLGTVARIPRDENMGRRNFERLEGSYRLPVRISECIKKLSETINQRFGNDEGATKITPYKGAPPGSRPIVVYGNSIPSLSTKISNVFNVYKHYDLNKITILEKDNELKNALSSSGIVAETDTILSLKGLEKECVLWSTRVMLEFEREAFEFAYTIVTRTSCILIIAIADDTKNVYKKILGMLDRERLIMWDYETESKYEELCEQYVAEAVIDE